VSSAAASPVAAGVGAGDGSTPNGPAAGAALAVRTAGLTRRFGHQVAVDSVDLAVPAGAVYGFLGPNGSGKTTTIRMLLGLIAADAGEIEVLGRPMPRSATSVLPRLGALIEGPAFHPYVNGRQNLRRLDLSDATANPATSTERIEAALARVGLTAAADKKYRNYSLGMKQRLGIAAALLQPRDLLVLDEPTNGLDPQGTREIRRLVRELAQDGTTVLVSSHLLSEVEQVATHVGMMAGGRLVRQGTLADVLDMGPPEIRIDTPDGPLALEVLARLELPAALAEGAPAVTASLVGLPVDEVAAALVRAGVRLQGLRVNRPSLEDLFVSITGEGFDVIR
jgi:ABC-type multidrug transport system ATPase subunit